jgi:hypothetical protein
MVLYHVILPRGSGLEATNLLIGGETKPKKAAFPTSDSAFAVRDRGDVPRYHRGRDAKGQ